MQHSRYTFFSEKSLSYEFESIGQNGTIRKIVEFKPTGQENVFNLGFGDCSGASNSIDDLTVTNNKDTQKVLATVATIVRVFTEQYEEALIFATGSTPARTRLYRIGISVNLTEICQEFAIFGYTSEGEWEKFVKGCDYEAFLLTRKQNNIHL